MGILQLFSKLKSPSRLSERLELKHLILTLTYACQLRCKMCGQVNLPAGKGLAPGNLDINLTLQRLKSLSTLKTCYLFGGEPLLHPDFFKLVEYLKSRNVSVGFSTNGLLLGKYAQQIIDSGVDMLSVSVDSHHPEVHDEIRGMPGLFSRVTENLRHFFSLRSKSSKALPSVKVHFTILQHNIDDMIGYYDYFAENFHGLDMIKFHFPRFVTPDMSERYVAALERRFSVCPTSHLGNFSENSPFSDVDCQRLYDVLAVLMKRSKTSVTGPVELDAIRQYFLDPCTPPKGGRCACFKSMTVQPDGTAVNCADYPDIVYGSIQDSTLLELWNGDTAMRWRDYLDKNGNPGALARCSRLYPGINSKR